MDKTQAKARILAIRSELNLLNKAYFTDNQELLPEPVRDSLKRELIQLENEFPDLIDENSPSQKIGSELSQKFKKVKHAIKKESLTDVFNMLEIQEWEDRLQKILPEAFNYLVELKIDGLNISLTYNNGVLIRALTRGDGLEGEDVTHNIKTIKTIPSKLNSNFSGEIIGEVFFAKEDFINLNQNSVQKFANARNAASGTVRQLNEELVSLRNLSFCPYAIWSSTMPCNSQLELMQFLSVQGFKVEENYQLCADLSAVKNFIQTWTEKRGDLPIDIDGVVIKINSFRQQIILGSTAKAPRWAVAYKFPASIAQSQILSIDLQVGRTGVITPVANLSPTILDGSTVSRATLHNFDEIKRKDIRVGDTVIIQKAGDIIPEVVEVILNMRSKDVLPYIEPQYCPVCEAILLINDNEVAVRCSNKNCVARQLEQFKHFCSRQGFDIRGLGGEILQVLMENKLIKEVADIFMLNRNDLLKLPFFKDKKADNLLEAINKSKKIKLANFLFALGIRFIGMEICTILANYFINQMTCQAKKIENSIENNDDFSLFDLIDSQANKNEHETEKYLDLKEFIVLAQAQIIDKNNLLSINGVGDKAVDSFIEYFQDESKLVVLSKLVDGGVYLEYEFTEKYEKKWQGMSFVITGTIENMSRDQVKKEIQNRGGKVLSAVSKKTNILVTGKNPGSKLEEAEKLGITVWQEINFINNL